jgi:hypothetical protein
MKELKDYFCTPEQSQKLKELGLNEDVLAISVGSTIRVVPMNYKPHPVEVEMPLRAQALDFFREKGYETIIEKYEAGYGYAIRFKVKKDTIIYLQGDFTPYEESESMLIDRLIEMELDKEVQDGN